MLSEKTITRCKKCNQVLSAQDKNNKCSACKEKCYREESKKFSLIEAYLKLEDIKLHFECLVTERYEYRKGSWLLNEIINLSIDNPDKLDEYVMQANVSLASGVSTKDTICKLKEIS